MRSWRRCLSTSTPKLNSTPPGPLALRCAQLFEASQPSLSDNTSLDHREVVIRGLVRSVRKQKHWAFAEISDGSTIQPVQAILSPEQAADLTTGGAVEISGVWTPSPGRNQSHELKATDVKLVGEADPQTYPIQKKYHSQDFLRTIPHLRFRTPFNSLLSRFRSECIYQATNVFHSRPGLNFIQVQPPLITSSDCEGAGEVFRVSPREAAAEGEDEEYFRAPKYLTVSSQLHLEAYAADLGNVWTLSPTFRAEKSDTPRHLSEFYMLEAELNFVNDLDELTKFVESFIRELTEKLYNTPVARELFTAKRSGESGRTVVNSEVTERWKGLMGAATWPRITYTEAIELLQNASMKSDKVEFKSCPSWPAGIQVEHEKHLVSTVGNGAPIFITDYPKALKPFYMAPSATQSTDPEKETVACFDLIMPKVCEVVGGSLREHRLENLIQNMREHEMLRARRNEGSSAASDDMTYPFLRPDENLGSLRWYADLRRWGSAPHGGFGLGFDRFLSYLTGVGSIRDVVPFPRYFGKADC
ncbi:asparaginyl-tRNA synthetase [Coccidioides posadasii str. Silveira]|uniref:asparagine--tRNA ligase n=3 Tax=Coccidioides posadasii TaxID=199306 RepID=E9D9V7_COCPS|nr:asparaginyl-tRNA synthetase, putative [Coccidioides posadasii C735 delta SOWgp]EER23240.1 asparaginyl-tRNA synthetase, putative [Coccidioides posadasii C735 delta SOWgp]EFW16688.1 asparaginyl-tRNA synthetase [Coccidioides posadasii str. Silveira]KMM64547.1 asparaginyl-tRNA synthetase [Coccidioides posadasii RMSCC 3488]QVM06618.1 asparaginyl-tRNA synthetase [Coccidioides posadasii str. Silveira]|eukprot:XP_003065385.1 asparaginyl-tRNA synthetase, putative [Coccidioides posadasii C735 delta SOWgp]